MKIVADENIPYVHELFDYFGEVITLPGRTLKSSDVKFADILLARSVTQVNADLLDGSNVRFVGTCTIGTDHLDVAYLASKNIAYTSAPGCNAFGVVQYVLAALAMYDRLDVQQTVGIIGCGNVGGRLYRILKKLGFSCRVYDPFLTNDQVEDLSNWEEVLASNIICMHAPLTKTGDFPTYHMINATALKAMRSDGFLLNAGRGAVINNADLLEHLGREPNMTVVLDVWENEPDILLPLLEKVAVGTPHIAGYSFEGRINGSLMIYQALAAFLGLDNDKTKTNYNHVKNTAYGSPVAGSGCHFNDIILNTYSPKQDHLDLLAAQPALPGAFDELRKNYRQRREFGHYFIPDKVDASLKEALLHAGFIEKGNRE